jgi:hypothetical protein
MSKSHQPERDFVTEFYKLMQKSANTNHDNTGQILYWYNAQFNKVSERYFKNSNWPPVETILPYANNGIVYYSSLFCSLLEKTHCNENKR